MQLLSSKYNCKKPLFNVYTQDNQTITCPVFMKNSLHQMPVYRIAKWLKDCQCPINMIYYKMKKIPGT